MGAWGDVPPHKLLGKKKTSRRRNPDVYIPTFLRLAKRSTRIRYNIDAFWNGTYRARRNLYYRLQAHRGHPDEA